MTQRQAWVPDDEARADPTRLRHPSDSWVEDETVPPSSGGVWSVLPALALVVGIGLLVRAALYPWNDLARGWAVIIGLVVMASSGILLFLTVRLRGELRVVAGMLALGPLALGVFELVGLDST